MITTRRSVEKDFELTFEIKKSALKDYIIQAFGPWKEDRQLAEHRKDFSSGQFEIIEADGVGAGYLWVRRTDKAIYLVDICVSPEYQGNGIGSRIIGKLLSEAKARRLPVELGVFKVNHSALKLYKKLGFNQTSETQTHILMRSLLPAGYRLLQPF